MQKGGALRAEIIQNGSQNYIKMNQGLGFCPNHALYFVQILHSFCSNSRQRRYIRAHYVRKLSKIGVKNISKWIKDWYFVQIMPYILFKFWINFVQFLAKGDCIITYGRKRSSAPTSPLWNERLKMKNLILNNMKRETWKFIVQLIVAILTAIATTLGVTSCLAWLWCAIQSDRPTSCLWPEKG